VPEPGSNKFRFEFTSIMKSIFVRANRGRNEILAILTIDEIYEWNKSEAATGIFGTTDPKHPVVAEMERWGS